MTYLVSNTYAMFFFFPVFENHLEFSLQFYEIFCIDSLRIIHVFSGIFIEKIKIVQENGSRTVTIDSQSTY